MTEMTPSDSLRVAIAGVAGRMGRQLVGAALDAGLTVVGGSEAPSSEHLGEDIGELAGRRLLDLKPATDPVAAAAKADVWIDFTRPAATLAALDSLKHTSVRAAIIGTTGFTDEEEAEIAQAAQSLAIVKAGNFSVGINLLQALTRMASVRPPPGWGPIGISKSSKRIIAARSMPPRAPRSWWARPPLQAAESRCQTCGLALTMAQTPSGALAASALPYAGLAG